MPKAASAFEIATGLTSGAADDFTRLNVTSFGLTERASIEDAPRILRLIVSGQQGNRVWRRHAACDALDP